MLILLIKIEALEGKADFCWGRWEEIGKMMNGVLETLRLKCLWRKPKAGYINLELRKQCKYKAQ